MKPQHEVADILALYGQEFLENNNIPSYKRKVLNDIEKCRTAYFGGHITQCPDCGHREASYNSCRNRHCPKCQGAKREKWIQDREADLLPVKYFHVVFTVDHELNSLFLKYQTDMYNLLFTTAWSVIKTFSEDEKHLGAKTAMISILHTWGQNLSYHPHLHCIVPAGGITKDGKWENSRNNGDFLFPVKAMSNVFRARLVEGVKTFVKSKNISLEGGFYNRLFEKPWVVYAKEPFDKVNSVLEYLGRYTHKIAISNHRLIDISNNEITFSAKNYRKNGDKEQVKLSADEFLRRYCLHILASGFRKIRHYGFLASRTKKENLAAIRKDLKVIIIIEKTKSNTEKEYTLPVCPACKKATMEVVETIVKERKYNQLE